MLLRLNLARFRYVFGGALRRTHSSHSAVQNTAAQCSAACKISSPRSRKLRWHITRRQAPQRGRLTNLAAIRGKFDVKFAHKFKSTSPSTAKFQKRITARQKRDKILPRACLYAEVKFSPRHKPLNAEKFSQNAISFRAKFTRNKSQKFNLKF